MLLTPKVGNFMIRLLRFTCYCISMLERLNFIQMPYTLMSLFYSTEQNEYQIVMLFNGIHFELVR